MRDLKVRDLMAYSKSRPSIVYAEAPVRDVAAELLADPSTREVYLVDADERFYGVITLRRLAHSLFTHDLPGHTSPIELLDLVSARNAHDLAVKKAVCVTEDHSIEHLVDLMFRFEIEELPVVDAERRIVGKIGMVELIAAWHAQPPRDDAPPEDR